MLARLDLDDLSEFFHIDLNSMIFLWFNEKPRAQGTPGPNLGTQEIIYLKGNLIIYLYLCYNLFLELKERVNPWHSG